MTSFKPVNWLLAAVPVWSLALIAVSGVVRADEVVLGNLAITQTENPPVVVTNSVKLGASRPSLVKVEPAYRGTPLYGILTVGNAANNKTVVVLDTFPNDTKPRLYVDLNSNGDLTDDPIYQLAPLSPTGSGNRSVGGNATAKRTVPMGVTVDKFVTRYDVKGVVREEKTPIQFLLLGSDLSFTMGVARLGTLAIGDTTYKIALVDQTGTGLFNQYQHSQDNPPKILVLIDRNNDGRFDPKREAFDLAKPFRLAGSAYEVANIDARGTIVGLARTTKVVEGGITSADLAVGGEVIDFAVKTVDGKTVHFPTDYKHKIVLLDFWAMWCGPCMAEMPNVVATYNRYNQYGFEILGVSLDQANKFNTLMDFLPANQMAWAQIYDGKYWNAEIAKLYGVDSIPRAILVDGDTGVILAMGDSLRGDGLASHVEQALAKKRR